MLPALTPFEQQVSTREEKTRPDLDGPGQARVRPGITQLRRQRLPAPFASASLFPESSPKLDMRNGDTRHVVFYLQGREVRH